MATTMEKRFLASWTASKGFAILGMILLCWGTSGQTRRAESLEGVVYSDHSGPSANSVGRIRLAVGDRVYELEYARSFLKTRFKSPVCWDIGAIWSVKVQDLSGRTGYLNSAECTGQVDEDVHGPQRVVREYLDLIGKGALRQSEEMISSKWRFSDEFKEYEARLRDIDMSSYRRFETRGGCLDAVRLERPGRTELRAGTDCYLKVEGEPVEVSFEVVRNTRTKRWQIDRIRLAAPGELDR